MKNVVALAELLVKGVIREKEIFTISSDVEREKNLIITITVESKDSYMLKRNRGSLLRAITGLLQNCANHYHLRVTLKVSE